MHPPLYLAPAYFPGLSRRELRAREKELYPPSLWVSREACELVYTELLESLADLGFRVCLAVSGHAPAERLLREIAAQHHGRIGGMRVWGGGTSGLLREALPELVAQRRELFGHGLTWETSNVMALDASWVDLERVSRIKASPLPSQLKPCSEEQLTLIVQEASAEFGNHYLDTAAQRLAAVAAEMLAESAAG